jgi:hypothetical protein
MFLLHQNPCLSLFVIIIIIILYLIIMEYFLSLNGVLFVSLLAFLRKVYFVHDFICHLSPTTLIKKNMKNLSHNYTLENKFGGNWLVMRILNHCWSRGEFTPEVTSGGFTNHAKTTRRETRRRRR